MKIKNYDIVIVGAGIAGRTIAVSFSQHNFNVAIIDKYPIEGSVSADFGLRVSAINHKSVELFKAIDIWDDISAVRVTPYEKMHVWNHNGAVDFDAAEVTQHELGFIIENQVMLSALSKKISELDIDCYQATPALLHQFHDGAQVQLDNNERLQAKLVVGADGANSWVRKSLDIPTKKRSYGHTAIVATVKIEQPHERTAWQRFTKTGPLALLPLSDENHCSIVWSQNKARAEELLSLSNEHFEQQLAQAFEDHLGEIALVSERKSFPLIMRHAEHYVDHRVALVADAIHTIHPLAGLGLNLGLKDVKCLVENVVEEREKNSDFTNLLMLRRYQRQRKSENLAVLSAMGGFNQLFNNDNEVLNWLRNKGLQTTNRLSLVKRMIAKAAAGI